MMNFVRRFLRFMTMDGLGTGVDGAKTLSAGATLRAIEWKLYTFVLMAVAFFKNGLGLSSFHIFLILWVGDITLSILTLLGERKSGLDITFMSAARRIIGHIVGWCRPIGYIAWALYMIWVPLWHGPAYLVSYFKTFFYPRPVVLTMAIVVLAGVQMAAWTPAYLAGVDLLEYLWTRLTGG